MTRFITLIMAILALTAALLNTMPVQADLRAPVPPGWWDPDGVQVGSDWHYRVPVTLPASNSINSTATVDVNFATLLTQLGISGTFDINSIRVVRPTGTLAATQEYTDTRFANATDATANNRGEVRWIVQDGGAQTYYIYFDITQNGAKAANAQPKINGNFEHNTAGTATPTGWNAPILIGTVDNQVRGSENPTVTSSPTASDGASRATDGTPRTGATSYLFGHRSFNSQNSDPGFTMTRAIVVPATNPGNLTVRWRPEGWDSGNYDFVRIDLTTANNATAATLLEMVGPTQGNYPTRPFSPNFGGASASTSAPGYRQYNGYDCTTTGTHTQGMTSTTCKSQPWWEVNQSLAAYAGQTVFLRFRFYSDAADKTWFHIDDIEWSVVTGTLGTAEGFGVGITQPAASGTLISGQLIAITAQVDARPTGAGTPVTANILNTAGTAMASGIVLFNDGTHGDATANDAIWTNNGTDAAFPTYTIPVAQPSAAGWTVRVFARDASTTAIGGTSGHVHRNTLPIPAIEANYWNIDDSVFDIVRPIINVSKISWVVSDPVNGGSSPKAIPGALVRYCITMTNPGGLPADNVTGADNLALTVLYEPNSLKSGTGCGTATTAEDDDAAGGDETDPVGASITGTAIGLSISSLAGGTTRAFTYDVRVVN